MLIQALAEYADTRLQDQLNDLAFETKPVPGLFSESAATGLSSISWSALSRSSAARRQSNSRRPC